MTNPSEYRFDLMGGESDALTTGTSDSEDEAAVIRSSPSGLWAIDPRRKAALVTIIRECERLRGLASELREVGLAWQLEALIHHAGARLVAAQTGLGPD